MATRLAIVPANGAAPVRSARIGAVAPAAQRASPTARPRATAGTPASRRRAVAGDAHDASAITQANDSCIPRPRWAPGHAQQIAAAATSEQLSHVGEASRAATRRAELAHESRRARSMRHLRRRARTAGSATSAITRAGRATGTHRRASRDAARRDERDVLTRRREQVPQPGIEERLLVNRA